MSRTTLSIYQAAVADRQRLYDEAIESGKYLPFIYPWDSFSALGLLLCVLFVPSLPSRLHRPITLLAFFLICLLCFSVIFKTRMINFAGGYGLGLMCVWGIIMTGVLVLINDPSKKFVRLERRPLASTKKSAGPAEADGDVTSASSAVNAENQTLRTREQHNGQQSARLSRANVDGAFPLYSDSLAWQAFPQSLNHRIDWAFDLITSFRGPNWNFRLSSLPLIIVPPPPKGFTVSARFVYDHSKSAQEQPTLHTIQRTAIKSFVAFYLLTDLLKAVMMTDPYFFALAPLSSSSPWPVLSTLNSSPVVKHMVTKLIRLGITLLAVFSGLSLIFSLSPIFFTIILPRLLPPRVLDRITASPILHPSLYPPYWSSPISSLSSTTSALGHIWSKSWHQLFRYGITAPSASFQTRRPIVRPLTAFTLTALLHASASHTAFPPNPANNPPRPILGPGVFFLLQPLGIALQTYLNTRILHLRHLPRPAVQLANLLFLLIWSYTTGPLLADDFARCGLWMFEPVPFSLFRPLLLGDRVLQWHGQGQRWVSLWPPPDMAEEQRRQWPWWRSGLAIY